MCLDQFGPLFWDVSKAFEMPRTGRVAGQRPVFAIDQPHRARLEYLEEKLWARSPSPASQNRLRFPAYIILTVDPSQSSTPETGASGFFISIHIKETLPMFKVTASPTFELSSNRNPKSSTNCLPIRVSAGRVGFKNTFLPRSLDLAVTIKYRR